MVRVYLTICEWYEPDEMKCIGTSSVQEENSKRYWNSQNRRYFRITQVGQHKSIFSITKVFYVKKLSWVFWNWTSFENTASCGGKIYFWLMTNVICIWCVRFLTTVWKITQMCTDVTEQQIKVSIYILTTLNKNISNEAWSKGSTHPIASWVSGK